MLLLWNNGVPGKKKGHKSLLIFQKGFRDTLIYYFDQLILFAIKHQEKIDLQSKYTQVQTP